MTTEPEMKLVDAESLRQMGNAIDQALFERKLEAIRTMPDEALAALRAEVVAELQTRRAPAPTVAPAAPAEIDGWRIAAVEPSTSRGLWDIEVTDGEHSIRFEACSDGGKQSPLEWAVEQVNAFDARSFAIACSHCPDQGEPTRPASWDEEADAEGDD